MEGSGRIDSVPVWMRMMMMAQVGGEAAVEGNGACTKDGARRHCTWRATGLQWWPGSCGSAMGAYPIHWERTLSSSGHILWGGAVQACSSPYLRKV